MHTTRVQNWIYHIALQLAMVSATITTTMLYWRQYHAKLRRDSIRLSVWRRLTSLQTDRSRTKIGSERNLYPALRQRLTTRQDMRHAPTDAVCAVAVIESASFVRGKLDQTDQKFLS